MSRVLVIDDEASICWAFRELLGDLGHEVAIAASAEEGIRMRSKTIRTWWSWTFGSPVWMA